MKRKKPDEGDLYEWKAFEAWADVNHIGDRPEDYSNWWECWKQACQLGQIKRD